MDPSNKEWAHACAARGWLVFPSRGKQPLVKWSRSATTDPAVVDVWWDAWPDADVCIKTGAESDLVVVDWDAYKQNAPDEFPLSPKPDTYTCQTLKGGFHFYFRHPGYPVSNSAGVVAEHVDIRGDGGMVVAYRPVADRPLADAPGHWLTRRQRAAPSPDANLTPPHDPQQEPRGWSKTMLTSAVISIKGADEGKRNATLYAVASDTYRTLCWEGPVRTEHVTQALGDAAHTIGLEPAEIANTLISAMRNAATKGDA